MTKIQLELIDAIYYKVAELLINFEMIPRIIQLTFECERSLFFWKATDLTSQTFPRAIDGSSYNYITSTLCYNVCYCQWWQPKSHWWRDGLPRICGFLVEFGPLWVRIYFQIILNLDGMLGWLWLELDLLLWLPQLILLLLVWLRFIKVANLNCKRRIKLKFFKGFSEDMFWRLKRGCISRKENWRCS